MFAKRFKQLHQGILCEVLNLGSPYLPQRVYSGLPDVALLQVPLKSKKRDLGIASFAIFRNLLNIFFL